MARATRAVWAARIARWEQSGLTAARFAARERINPRTLSFWKWKLRQTTTAAPAQASPTRRVAFVELPGATASAPALELQLPSGYRIAIAPGFDATTLQALLAVLEARQ